MDVNKILIIDDDSEICSLMTDYISRLGHDVATAQTLKIGMAKARSTCWDIVFLDVWLPDGNGIECLPEFKKLPSSPEVIVMTGHGEAAAAFQAIHGGAWDYCQKPIRIDTIGMMLKHTLEIRTTRTQWSGIQGFKRDRIIGESPELSGAMEAAADAARSDANVLIAGESGTGKELFARAIHENSVRSKGPFVVVDCAALPESLIESLLFGHEKGAFTGAERSRDGLIREAEGGTLFLDEVGELSLSHQKRFLRVLQERRFRTLGGKREFKSDFRLMSATHRYLDGMAADGTFREDLLFRLRGLSISLPRLSERSNDIKIITKHCIEKYCRRFRIEEKGTYPEFFKALVQYSWPGNVRELAAAVEAAVIQAKGEPMLHPIHLPIHIRADLAQKVVRNETDETARPGAENGAETLVARHSEYMQASEKKYFQDIATVAQGGMQEICRISGLSRSQAYRLMKKHDITLR